MACTAAAAVAAKSWIELNWMIMAPLHHKLRKKGGGAGRGGSFVNLVSSFFLFCYLVLVFMFFILRFFFF